MKAVLLVALLALSVVALAPTAAAESCAPNPRFVQVCQRPSGWGGMCYDLKVNGEIVHTECIQ